MARGCRLRRPGRDSIPGIEAPSDISQPWCGHDVALGIGDELVAVTAVALRTGVGLRSGFGLRTAVGEHVGVGVRTVVIPVVVVVVVVVAHLCRCGVVVCVGAH